MYKWWRSEEARIEWKERWVEKEFAKIEENEVSDRVWACVDEDKLLAYLFTEAEEALWEEINSYFDDDPQDDDSGWGW